MTDIRSWLPAKLDARQMYAPDPPTPSATAMELMRRELLGKTVIPLLLLERTSLVAAETILSNDHSLCTVYL